MNISHLRRRAGILRDIRRFFDDRGFCEVTTPILSADSIADLYVEPIRVREKTLPRETMYLHTSPELAMKRLLAAGMEAIYQMVPVFRQSDRGRWHNVEFTMLEWYRVGDDETAGMALLSDLVDTLLQRGPAETRTFRELFEWETRLDPHTSGPVELRAAVRDRSIPYPESYDRPGSRESDDPEPWIDLLFSETVQPYLGLKTPTIVTEFPRWQAQLAKTRPASERLLPKVGAGPEPTVEVAARFELFVDGIELANGYDESTESEVLHRRNREINDRRRLAGCDPLPQEHFLKALEQGFPVCSGTALGVDRLLMILFGASSIDEVIAFPIEQA